MTPEKAWQSALRLIRDDMPKSAFDTWVRGARFEGFDPDTGVFTVGAPDDYARDWLTDRLSSTLSRLLTGMLKQTVEVQFTTIADDDQVVALSLEAYRTVYEQIVRPDRRVVLPGYFRRWLPVLGPKLAWMYVAMRQLAYQYGERHGTVVKRFSTAAVAALSGMSRRTARRILNNPAETEKLDGLVARHSGAEQEQDDPQRNLPNRFTIAMTLPLTAVDAYALSLWLSHHVEAFESVQELVQAACETPLGDLIPFDTLPAPPEWQPATVSEILRDLFGNLVPPPELEVLASQLQNHLMPSNDTIHITLFFLEHVLPHLGAGPGWLLTLLRDRCWVDPDTGETRNTVFVRQGYRELAHQLGLKRPKTIWEWLRPGKPLSLYLTNADNGESNNGQGLESGQWFEVLLEELHPTLLRLALTPAWDTLGPCLAAVSNGETVSEDQWRACLQHLDENTARTLARLIPPLGAFVPPSMARLSYPMARLTYLHGAIVRLKSSLSSGLNLNLTESLIKPVKKLNYLHDNTQDSSKDRGEPEAAQVRSCRWGWENLFRFNTEINPRDQQGLRDNDPLDFVLWMIYAYSPKGRGITNPALFAVRKVQAEEQPRPDLRVFRSVSPDDLREMLAEGAMPTWEQWLPQDQHRRAELAQRLFGA